LKFFTNFKQIHFPNSAIFDNKSQKVFINFRCSYVRIIIHLNLENTWLITIFAKIYLQKLFQLNFWKYGIRDNFYNFSNLSNGE